MYMCPSNGVMVFFPPLFCLLKPQLVEADGLSLVLPEVSSC